MLSKNSIWLIFIAMAAGIAALVYIYSSQIMTTPQPSSVAPVSMSEQAKLAPLTGNIEDIAKEMTEELTSESVLVSEANDESATLDEEIEALDELGQSYDENEF